MITFEDVKNNEEINAYIRAADKVMDSIGYTNTPSPTSPAPPSRPRTY